MSLQDIETRIAKTTETPPVLIAVSKEQPDVRVRDALQQGHRVFGENKVQEAQAKWPAFRDEFGAIELHLLGPLQTNKVKSAMALFDVFHALDRPKLARKIATERDASGRCPDLFVQVNIGDEKQKAGVAVSDLNDFLSICGELALPVIGLMCIPPANEDSRPYFVHLRELAKKHNLEGLSMGMSGDFEVAITEGATHIRVGSAIFGERDYG